MVEQDMPIRPDDFEALYRVMVIRKAERFRT
jgi:hypothetical protein